MKVRSQLLLFALLIAPCVLFFQNCSGSSSVGNPPVSGGPVSTVGAVGLYEAEAGTLGGSAVLIGAADGSDRTVGDLGGEASGRQAVTLSSPTDSLSFTVRATEADANAIGDTLQDSVTNSATGLSMWALADHNLQSLKTCLTLTTATGTPYLGVWIHFRSTQVRVAKPHALLFERLSS